jgi:hypothetical protein
MNAAEQWTADMDVWALDPAQRLHYLRRLRDHNAQLLDRMVAGKRRLDVVQVVLVTALAVNVMFGVMVWLATR